MRQRKEVRLYQRSPGGVWHADIQIAGIPRIRFSTETINEELAGQIAAERKKQALLIRDGIIAPDALAPSLSLSQAFGKYQAEHEGQADAANADRYAVSLLTYFRPQTAFASVTSAHLLDYRTWLKRRTVKVCSVARPISNATVNHHLSFFHRVVRRAAAWGIRAPAGVDWRELFLEVADPPRRVIRGPAEQKQIMLALEEDTRDLIQFMILSGLRRRNAIYLRWAEIDRHRDIINTRVKSRRPGGRNHPVQITPAIAAILDRQEGLHPEFVFTYLCQKSRSWIDDNGDRGFRRKGQRYPFTESVIAKRWNAMREATGCDAAGALGLHRLRATAITRVYDASGNLKVAQQFGGHSDVATTLRYVSVDGDDVRRAMLAVEGHVERKAPRKRKARVVDLAAKRKAG